MSGPEVHQQKSICDSSAIWGSMFLRRKLFPRHTRMGGRLFYRITARVSVNVVIAVLTTV